MSQVKSYEHSRVFDLLKQTKEKIAGNYTSLQYLQTLDYFLWQSLKPIHTECPSLFLNYLAKVVARQSLRSSAKLTSGDRAKLPIQLFNTLMQTDPEKAFDQSRLLYINRGIMFGFINFFLRRVETYMALHQSVQQNMSSVERATRIHKIEQELGVARSDTLYSAVMQVIHWDGKARNWKGLVTQKYTRMALLNAQNTYKDYNHSVDLNDVVQTYMLVVNKAIDRCDARQGVLTTFIQNWFKSARGEVAKEAAGQHDSSYEELTEEHGDAIHDVIGVHAPDLSAELQEQIAYVAKKVDPAGMVRTSLGIPQFVGRHYRTLLESFVYEPPEFSEPAD